MIRKRLRRTHLDQSLIHGLQGKTQVNNIYKVMIVSRNKLGKQCDPKKLAALIKLIDIKVLTSETLFPRKLTNNHHHGAAGILVTTHTHATVKLSRVQPTSLGYA